MKIQFSFEIRMAMQVAMAVAEEIENNTCYGRSIGDNKESKNQLRPVLLSIQGNCFRFEGGIVVDVQLNNSSQFIDDPEEWVCVGVKVRYYPRNKSHSRSSDVKTEESWDYSKLAVLKRNRWWYHPHVVALQDIESDG